MATAPNPNYKQPITEAPTASVISSAQLFAIASCVHAVDIDLNLACPDHDVGGSTGTRVSTSTPSAVTQTVCSNCALH